jgi:hypothetical protein
MMNTFTRAVFAAVIPLAFTGSLMAHQELMELKNEGFVSLFDGKTLDGWTEIHKGAGPSYFVTPTPATTWSPTRASAITFCAWISN